MDGVRSEWMGLGVNGWSYELMDGIRSEWFGV